MQPNSGQMLPTPDLENNAIFLIYVFTLVWNSDVDLKEMQKHLLPHRTDAQFCLF